MEIDSDRASDPLSISPAAVDEALTTRGRLVVQFSRPAAYDAGSLQKLNAICRRSPETLEVRFFGHYGTTFDAGVLRHLPDVRNLSIDCLETIQNEDEIAKLVHLSHFRFGVFDFDSPSLLGALRLEQLKSVALGETKKRNLDLSPLANCKSLERLFVHGHWSGIQAIAGLPHLKHVTLSAIARDRRLEFLGDLPDLQDLFLILGGRDDLAEFASQSLQTLQIVRVRNLSSLGDLSRFPRLRHLRIEDQLQLKSLDLTGAQLERLWLSNCKNLEAVVGLDQQNQLREIFVSQVALNLDHLRDFEWPLSAQVVGLFSGSRKWNDRTKDHLASRGFAQRPSHWT